MATLLARRAGAEIPLATNDQHQQIMTSDPSIPQFPSGDQNAFGQSSGGATTFGSAQAGGFGGGGFGSSAPMGAPNSGGFGGQQQQQSQQLLPQQPAGELLKSGGGAMSEGGESKIAVDQGFSDFINKRWRPLMAVIYMVTCTTDFVLFPILWSVLQAMSKGQVNSQWIPLTLQGAGLYHIAMGAVLGLAAYGRSQEKIAGKA